MQITDSAAPLRKQLIQSTVLTLPRYVRIERPLVKFMATFFLAIAVGLIFGSMATFCIAIYSEQFEHLNTFINVDCLSLSAYIGLAALFPAFAAFVLIEEKQGYYQYV